MSSPFDEGACDDEPVASRRRKLPTWWRWNVVTLSVSLFVLMWGRELSRLDGSATYAAVLLIVVLWSVAPLVVVWDGRWPLSVSPRQASEGRPRARDSTRRLLWFAFACRVAGVKVVLAGVTLSATSLLGVLREGLFGRTLPVELAYLLQTIGWPALSSIAGAIGLWTIGEIAIAVAERQDD